MKVLVDTCIWSLALRKAYSVHEPFVDTFQQLIQDVRVQLIGPIRQEILSGIASKLQFEKLRTYLSAFPDLPLEKSDYELAAEYFNINRSKGIQGSNTDFLICALSFRHKMPIFSCDKDFELYSKNIPIELYV